MGMAYASSTPPSWLPTLPGLNHKCCHYAVAVDNGPTRPRRSGDAGAARGRPDMAPPPPLVVNPPVTYRDQCQALPNGAERLVGG